VNPSILPPASLFAGTSFIWTMNLPGYLPADGWSLVVDIANAGNHYQATSTDNGDGLHLITLTSAFTTPITPGDYTMAISATNGTDLFHVNTTQLTIRPNLSSAVDARSHVKKTLDALEAWIESRSPAVSKYQIAGRSMEYWPAAELLAFHSRYRQLYQNELNAARLANGQKPRRRLLTRMAG